MSQHINYSIEKFSKATLALAASAEPIQTRLRQAVSELEILREIHIPDSLHQQFADLIDHLTNGKTRTPDSVWSSDLGEITDDRAVEFAGEIVNFSFSLQYWRAWDKDRSSN